MALVVLLYMENLVGSVQISTDPSKESEYVVEDHGDQPSLSSCS